MPDIRMNRINPYVLSCSYLRKSDCPPQGTHYEERQVKWYEVELITWGEGHIFTEGKKIPTRKGDLFFRKPGMIVQGVSPYSCYLVLFDMVYDSSKHSLYNDTNYLNAGVPYEKVDSGRYPDSDFYGLGFPFVMNTVHSSRFEELFASIYNDFLLYGRENQFCLKTHLMQILLTAYNEKNSAGLLHRAGRSFRLNYPKVLAAKKFIDGNLQARFSLARLSEIAGLSPNFFCRIFKDIIGEPPIAYINKSRINLAKKLLVETTREAKEIAYECGFENPTYFFTLFKKYTGISPIVYREKQQLRYF